jgi:hypothetical protein
MSGQARLRFANRHRFMKIASKVLVNTTVRTVCGRDLLFWRSRRLLMPELLQYFGGACALHRIQLWGVCYACLPACLPACTPSPVQSQC